MKRLLQVLTLTLLLGCFVPTVCATDGNTELPGITSQTTTDGNTELPGATADGNTELPGFTALLIDVLSFIF